MELNETVNEFFRAYNTHDVNAIQAILAEDAQLIVPTNKSGAAIQGSEAIIQLIAGTFEILIPDIHEDILTVTIQGNVAAAEVKESGTYTIPANAGTPAVKGYYELNCALFFHINSEGKFDRIRSYWDTFPWSLQVGIPIDLIHSRYKEGKDAHNE